MSHLAASLATTANNGTVVT